MFTGIIVSTGNVQQVCTLDTGLRLWIDLSGIGVSSIALGDSIAVNGVCLTVTEMAENAGAFDLSEETVSRTLCAEWEVGTRVNLEPALTLQTPLGGHLVSGHVDGTGRVKSITQRDDFCLMAFSVGEELGGFIAEKGSVAIDGVSLTINAVEDFDQRTRFGVTLVPHTLAHTTLGDRIINDAVHIEVDQVVRYILRLESFHKKS